VSKKSVTYQENPWFLVAFVLLAGLLFFPPYFRGLFFPKEQLVAFIAALWAFFAVWMYKSARRDLAFFRNPIDYFALAVVACYLIAIFGAANYRLAVQGFVKMSLFFLVYWVAGELSKKEQWGKILTGVLYATGVGVALAGLGAALGVVEINDGFVSNRIFSTLQYPNSLAVYLLFMSFIGFYFWSAGNKWAQFLFAAGNYFILMTFLGTNSRGGLLVAVVMIPLFLIGLAKEHRIWVLFSLLFTGGGVLIGSWRFIPSIVAQNPTRAWLFLGLGLATVLVGHGILLLARQFLGDRRTILALAGVIGVVLVAGAVYVAQREVTLNQITNPNAFDTYTDAAATATLQEDGWNRVDVTRVGHHSLVGRTGGYGVKPGETVTYTVEFKSPSGQWVPWLTGSRGVGQFEQVDDTTWTITWTNEDEVNRGEYVYFRHLTEANQDLEDAFYFRNPTAVIEGQTVTFWQKVLPRQFWERMQTIDTETVFSQERIFWSREALQLIKNRPLTGYGGGGWESVYRSNQAYNYSSTQVHNDWLQLGVETGTLGLLAWLGLWAAWLYSGFTVYKASSGRERTFVWAIMAGVVTIGGHALIDFDLSLGAVSIALWFGFGVISGLVPVKAPVQESSLSHRAKERGVGRVRTKYVPLGIGILCLLFTLAAGSLIVGHNYGSQAIAAVRQGDGNRGLEYFNKASIYDPFQASYNIDAARLSLLKGDLEQAVRLGEKAVKQDRFNWQIHLNLAEIYWQQGDLERSVQAAERARNCAPLVQNVNNSVARVYALAGIRYLEEGNEEAAWPVFEQVAAMPAQFTGYFEQLPEKVQKLWSPGRRLTVGPELALNVGIAEYFLGNTRQAVEHLELALNNEANRAETMVWLAVAKTKLGQMEEAQALMNQVPELDERVAQNYYSIVKLPTRDW
jgi:Flp pilus assembly protein TadD